MENSTNFIQNPISRRKFFRLAGGTTFFVSASVLIPTYLLGEGNNPSIEEKPLSVWVHFHENGKITIYNPASEMGQGSMTAVPVIYAEELDADWSKVVVKNSPADPEIFGAGWGGRGRKSMITVGSRTVNSYFNSMRQAGAQTRYVLLSNVAQKWSVPISELTTDNGIVIHSKSDRNISYGEIATFATSLSDIPEIPEEQLKRPEQFRLIGKVVPRVDIPTKVDGSAIYSIDIKVPGMVYGVINRSLVHGAKPNLKNRDELIGTEGVMDIVEFDHGVGLIAESLELALEVKKKMQIDWSQDAKAATHSSDEAYEMYGQHAGDASIKGDHLTDKGDIESALREGMKTYSIDYKNDYVYHAQMEPLNAVVSVSEDGQQAEGWIGTQAPGNARNAIANTLGIDASQVTFHRTYLGGGFGRRSNSDFIVEATLLSKAVKKPVKLLWTREDDLQYGMFRPMSLQRMEASLDDSGKIQGWRHIIVGTGDRLLGSGARTDYYSFPHQRVEVRNIDHGIRTKHWRAVGHGPNKFAIEAFVDEIAADQGKDPVEFRMELMKDFPRAQKVLSTVAEMADWGAKVPEGRAKGIAFAERSGSLAACVCEISLNRETGKIKVHHVWTSLDAGIIVQPDNVIAQMEGGVLMGLSSIMSERISFNNGKVEQSNYHDYPILRMSDIPETLEVKLISSTEHPTGVGESGIPIIGGAVVNAFGTLTGKRLRHMPFTAEKVLKVLEG